MSEKEPERAWKKLATIAAIKDGSYAEMSMVAHPDQDGDLCLWMVNETGDAVLIIRVKELVARFMIDYRYGVKREARAELADLVRALAIMRADWETDPDPGPDPAGWWDQIEADKLPLVTGHWN